MRLKKNKYLFKVLQYIPAKILREEQRGERSQPRFVSFERSARYFPFIRVSNRL